MLHAVARTKRSFANYTRNENATMYNNTIGCLLSEATAYGLSQTPPATWHMLAAEHGSTMYCLSKLETHDESNTRA
jgi:hypothetical protein